MGNLSGMTKEQQAFVRAAIKAARESGYKDGRDDSRRESPYHLTEKRLYAIPDLEDRIQQWHDDINELETKGIISHHSKDIVMMSVGSRGISEEDKIEAIIRKKSSEIESDERELRELRWALKRIETDEYYQTVVLHYILKIRDDHEKADKMGLEFTTALYKNRVRLVKRLTAMLYGSKALQ